MSNLKQVNTGALAKANEQLKIVGSYVIGPEARQALKKAMAFIEQAMEEEAATLPTFFMRNPFAGEEPARMDEAEVCPEKRSNCSHCGGKGYVDNCPVCKLLAACAASGGESKGLKHDP